MTHTSVQPLLDFIAASPSCYHVVSNLAARLTAEGYTPLSERDRWTLTPGGRYFVTRSSSSILAFRVSRKLTGGFMMTAAHSDSPTFKIKENAELTGQRLPPPGRGEVRRDADEHVDGPAPVHGGPGVRAGQGPASRKSCWTWTATCA